MQVIHLSIVGLILVNIFAWLIIHVSISYICLRLPDSFYESKKSMLQNKKWELKVYDRIQIKKWKTILPDGGDVFKGGFRKKELKTLTSSYIRKFILETRRAEVTHWLLIPPSFLFFLWNPLSIGLVMVGYSLIVNLPFILIQRYNRLRLKPLLHRQLKKEQRRGNSIGTLGV
ncbi:glycosyl-4,4'-diaponeurosporenoate acyltransferase [Anaerobacillus sp. 1_MG-2023]|uniref:glycosyl-4,4'-diaponeurosporenoate acyltransferase CrtO family protein n=1 Tax=Bacillales TaxID=1385 RepID=UPI0026E44738|nr:glycosyl-4,4'-diaponeurosporenoate acyltransferase [Anaerobacillus sp. 1_MG-2023]MDO6655842.1 glycosyl-4,4'-diaponeurosporenoate acyltransferase [Anaerobacillus sp. 1_MG-2023]